MFSQTGVGNLKSRERAGGFISHTNNAFCKSFAMHLWYSFLLAVYNIKQNIIKTYFVEFIFNLYVELVKVFC